MYNSYQIIAQSAELVVSLAEVKAYLKLEPSDTSQDDYLTMLIRAATNFAELYTKRTFIVKTFRTYRSYFYPKVELRRSRLQSLESFEYLKSGVFTTVDSNLYYTTDEMDFSKIVLKEDETYPTDIDQQLQNIKIEFIAGFGVDGTFVPDELKLALLQHIAKLYTNVGDCDKDNGAISTLEASLPQTAQSIYRQWRIPEMIGETDNPQTNTHYILNYFNY